jgi:hypothetical protein
MVAVSRAIQDNGSAAISLRRDHTEINARWQHVLKRLAHISSKIVVRIRTIEHHYSIDAGNRQLAEPKQEVIARR